MSECDGVPKASEETLEEVRDAITGAFPTPIANYALETGGNLDDIKSDLDAVLLKLDVALSTRASEATLILIKTDLDNIYGRLDVALSTRASESTLASVSASLITTNATLSSMLTQLQNDKDFEETVWIDKTTQIFYIRRATLTESSGAIVISWSDTAGTTVVPSPTVLSNLVQVSSSLNLKITSTGFRATASGTGYSTGDRILEIVIVNTDNRTVASSLWINTTTNTVIAAPTLANLKGEYEDALNTINTSVQATLATLNLLSTNFGAQADTPATTDIGTFSFIALFKRQLQKLTAIAANIAIMAAWNETARAAVNIIVGQPGVDGGAGAASAKTIRAITASDSPDIAILTDIKTSVQILDDIVFAEDASHVTADKGIMALGVRNDTRISRSSTNSDYTPLALSQYGEVLISYSPGVLLNGAETAVAGTAVIVSAANAANVRVLVQNTGTANMRVGVAGVTAITGILIIPKGHKYFDLNEGAANDIYAIREGAISTVALAQPTR